MHILATAQINYKGHRIIAQSIIPGILNNSDLSTLAEYGSVDEGKTVTSKPEFHELMKKVCSHLNIETCKVKDPSGSQPVEIAGSSEIKGIRGTDRRRYLVDLHRLTPRDFNYPGEENNGCLLRTELLVLY